MNDKQRITEGTTSNVKFEGNAFEGTMMKIQPKLNSELSLSTIKIDLDVQEQNHSSVHLPLHHEAGYAGNMTSASAGNSRRS